MLPRNLKQQLILLFSIAFFTSNAFASVECPIAKIQMIKEDGDKLFIQLEGQSWHLLAQKEDSDYEKKYTRAMKAQRKDRAVQLTFPNGYDDSCLSTDSNIVAKKIKLIKNDRFKD